MKSVLIIILMTLFNIYFISCQRKKKEEKRFNGLKQPCFIRSNQDR